MKRKLMVFASVVLICCILLSAVACKDEGNNSATENNTTAPTEPTDGDYGEIIVNDIYAWVGDYPASDFYYSFTKPEYGEELKYSYDTSALEIDEEKQTVKALKKGKHEVTLTGKHFSQTFHVIAEEVNKNAYGSNGIKKYDKSNFIAGETRNASRWNSKGKDGVSTIFIGDSFFDDYFWSSFYASYPGKEVIQMGISATTSYDWEQYATSWLKNTKPQNIVMHMGTNNVYDDGDGATSATSALQRMFTVIHDALPDTQIYWFSISQRSDVGSDKQGVVKTVNKNMKNWCDERDYITYIHTVDILTANMLRDGVHPKPENYYVFVNALAKTDIVIADDPGYDPHSIADVTNTVAQRIDVNTGTFTVQYMGKALSNNYIMTGKIDIKEFGGNPHIQFRVDSNNRFLLWKKGDGKLHLYLNTDGAINNSIPEEDKYALHDTVTWKIVRTSDDCYLYMDGELKMVLSGVMKSGTLNLGSEDLACKFYDMNVLTLADDESAYNTAIAEYADDINTYGSASNGCVRP